MAEEPKAIAYYNEVDPYAAQWLRNLVAAGHIAPGHVDERSIEDVKPDDLRKYTQCHFFAGIGVWSLALRRAGWPDHRPIWTGSCPCQPFSASGKKSGFDDERHLWPAWQWVIRECKPPALVGEQVASKSAEPWLDLVQADLEALGYAFGAIAFPSASVGAPHIRDRTYWVGYTRSEPSKRYPGSVPREEAKSAIAGSPDGGHGDGHTDASKVGGMADTQHKQRPRTTTSSNEAPRRIEEPTTAAGLCRDSGTGPTNGFWRDADWLFCRDGKWRPVEPGTSPLAHGTPARVGRLRAYGNAINVEAAAVFIESFIGAQAND